MSYLSWLFVTAYLEGLIYSLVGFVLCARQLWSIYWVTSPHVKLDVLMMGIGEGDQITDGNWDA